MKLSKNGRLIFIAALMLGGCSAVDVILPGERLDIRTGEASSVVANQSAKIRLSSQTNHTAWTHRAGNASHSIRHAAFSDNPRLIWAAPIGQGADRQHRIIADPVSTGGRIFTIDSRATVAATNAAGAPLWARDLTPAGENTDDASGGGLAAVGDVVYATTGFGDLVALNANNGAEIWRQRLQAPATGAPTVKDGIIYVVTRDSRGWAINASDGRIEWQISGTPDTSGIVGGAGPAVGDRLAVFPFGTAELTATLRKGGLFLWNGSVTGTRLGKAYGNINDITGDPVLTKNAIYAGNPAGRTVALDPFTGERIWTAQEGATGPVWVDGGSLFLVSDQAELVRLNASNGNRIWGSQMPNVVPTRNKLRTRDVYSHFGPVLAGGRLWVTSNDGMLRGFSPTDGAMNFTVEIPSGGATRPIVVDRTMYIVSQDGQLLAFR